MPYSLTCIQVADCGNMYTIFILRWSNTSCLLARETKPHLPISASLIINRNLLLDNGFQKSQFR